MAETTEDLLISVLSELMTAEAAYRSAMHIYKDHPGHHTRIHAECRWRHAKDVASTVLKNCGRANEQRTKD